MSVTESLLTTVVEWIIDEGHRFNALERQCDAHCEHLGEVYTAVRQAIQRQPQIQSLEVFVRTIANREFRRAAGRERRHSARHTPTSAGPALDTITAGDRHRGRTGQAIDEAGGRSGPIARDVLDGLVRDEMCRSLAAVAEQLKPRPPRRATPFDHLYGPSPSSLPGYKGNSLRTWQRRRKQLLPRAYRILED